MSPETIKEAISPIASNLPCRHRTAGAVAWRQVAIAIRSAGGQLLTLWGADDRDRDGHFRVFAAYLQSHGLTVIDHPIEGAARPTYPSLAEIFPSASRMERALFDLLGIRSMQPDHRGWLRHGGWPEGVFPLRRDFDAQTQFPVSSQPYPFVQVEGDGVHEIPVGPVHAGTIEPGHFRFSVVGEKVLRLEERLGYKHKGIAKTFEATALQHGHRLAARISGDSAVAYSWAYCTAVEAITQATCPERALHLRAIALEHERIANHLGDLGALGNDAGFAFGLTQFSRLKEDLLRLNNAVFGARYLLDYIQPGGVAADLPEDAPHSLLRHYDLLEQEIASLKDLYDNHAGLQDRFRGAGILTPKQARELDATGLIARASGIARDLRVDFPWPPYNRLDLQPATETSGDVAARVNIRMQEIFDSLEICRALVEHLPTGPIRTNLVEAEPGQHGLGIIEGWRGPLLFAVETGARGAIRRCHTHDPSVQNWPLLEYAILGNIVPDFPLINKSFNLSYSGHDG